MADQRDSRLAPFPRPIEGKIDTEGFLEAAEGVVQLVDKFGKVFAPVKSDMSGNIGRINKCYQTDKVRYITLQDIVDLAIEEGNNDVISALLWLTRGLHFMELFIEKILETVNKDQPEESLKNELTHAYTFALKPYHGWLNQKVFLLICRMCPSRTDFLKSIKNTDDDDELFLKKVDIFLQTLRVNRCEINRFYAEKNLNDNDVV